MQNESLDTNILLRFILNDIPKQREIAIKLLSKPDQKYNVTDLAITEVAYVLEVSHKRTRQFVVASIQQILTQLNICCNRALFYHALPLYESHPSLSFNDCCLAAYAAIDQTTPLWTFDRKFAAQSSITKLAT
jgi:predicted nucleic-acid-binding protein